MAKFCGNCGADLSKSNGVCSKCQGELKFSENGVINRAKLKEAAKEKLSGNMFNIWKPILVVFGISLIYSVFYINFMDADNAFSLVIDLIFSFISLPLSVGIVFYMIKLVRNEEFSLSNLFEFYDGRIITVFVLSFLVGIFVFLWSLLFIIPGIIAAISYTMYIYIYADGVKENPMDVISESKRLMNGYKWDYFVFNLSFIGWMLLGAVSFGLAYIYVVPYVFVSEVMYYDELKKIKSVE
jgi:uncharacterized membrane protein